MDVEPTGCGRATASAGGGAELAAPAAVDILRSVADRGQWGHSDREALAAACHCAAGSEAEKMFSTEKLDSLLGWWSRSEEFGERYLAALRAYQDAFFAEEERRIAPALRQALARAQDLAERLGLLDLLEELSTACALRTRQRSPSWSWRHPIGARP